MKEAPLIALLLLCALISCTGKKTDEHPHFDGYVRRFNPDTDYKETSLELWLYHDKQGDNISLKGIESLFEDDIDWLTLRLSNDFSLQRKIWIDISEMDFSLLKSLPNLKHLRIDYAQFNKMPDFGVMPYLEDIWFKECKIMSLEGIETARQIKELWVDFANEYYGDFIPLSALTELEKLIITGAGYWNRTDEGWENTFFHASDLSGLSKLKKLIILVDNILNLQGIPALTQLEELSLALNIANMHELADLKNLKTLHAPIPTSAVLPDFFGTLTNLTELELYGNGKAVDLSPLRKLRNLEHLKIGDTWKTSNNSTIMSLDFLASLTNLTSLKVTSNGNTLDITPLKNLKNLEEVSLYNFTIMNFQALDDLPKLEEVATYGSMFYPADNNKLKNVWVRYEDDCK